MSGANSHEEISVHAAAIATEVLAISCLIDSQYELLPLWEKIQAEIAQVSTFTVAGTDLHYGTPTSDGAITQYWVGLAKRQHFSLSVWPQQLSSCRIMRSIQAKSSVE